MPPFNATPQLPRRSGAVWHASILVSQDYTLFCSDSDDDMADLANLLTICARPMRPVGLIYPCLGQVSVSLKHHQTEKLLRN